jgi:hypothetical protein
MSPSCLDNFPQFLGYCLRCLVYARRTFARSRANQCSAKIGAPRIRTHGTFVKRLITRDDPGHLKASDISAGSSKSRFEFEACFDNLSVEGSSARGGYCFAGKIGERPPLAGFVHFHLHLLESRIKTAHAACDRLEHLGGRCPRLDGPQSPLQCVVPRPIPSSSLTQLFCMEGLFLRVRL